MSFDSRFFLELLVLWLVYSCLSIILFLIMWKYSFLYLITYEGMEYFLNNFYLIKTYSFTLDVNFKGLAIYYSYNYFFFRLSWYSFIFSHIFWPSNFISWIFDMIGVHSSLILSLLLLLLLPNYESSCSRRWSLIYFKISGWFF